MRLFIVSDTHDCPDSELELIPKEAKKRNCDCIIHCGDLNDEHFGHPALGDLPFWVIRTRQNESIDPKIIENVPAYWHVLPDNDHQIITFGKRNKIRIYIYHYLGVDTLKSNLGMPTPEAQLHELARVAEKKTGLHRIIFRHMKSLGRLLKKQQWPRVMPYELVEKIRSEFGQIRYVLFGHSHHQFFHVNNQIALVNPGAFELDAIGRPKRSFVVIDTKTWDIVFSKVLV